MNEVMNAGIRGATWLLALAAIGAVIVSIVIVKLKAKERRLAEERKERARLEREAKAAERQAARPRRRASKPKD